MKKMKLPRIDYHAISIHLEYSGLLNDEENIFCHLQPLSHSGLWVSTNIFQISLKYLFITLHKIINFNFFFLIKSFQFQAKLPYRN